MNAIPVNFVADANDLLDGWSVHQAHLAELLRQREALDERIQAATRQTAETRRAFDAFVAAELERPAAAL